jgi:hypothetical protein
MLLIILGMYHITSFSSPPLLFYTMKDLMTSPGFELKMGPFYFCRAELL